MDSVGMAAASVASTGQAVLRDPRIKPILI